MVMKIGFIFCTIELSVFDLLGRSIVLVRLFSRLAIFFVRVNSSAEQFAARDCAKKFGTDD